MHLCDCRDPFKTMCVRSRMKFQTSHLSLRLVLKAYVSRDCHLQCLVVLIIQQVFKHPLMPLVSRSHSCKFLVEKFVLVGLALHGGRPFKGSVMMIMQVGGWCG